MGRKTQITQEMILEASYELLDEGGIGNVEIKKIADRLGCSTRPVTWTFGSMAELKKELYFFASNKLFEVLPEKMAGKPAFEAFFISGVHYISCACDHPNVFRFINVDSPEKTIGESITGNSSIFMFQFDKEALKLIASEYDIPEEALGKAVRDVVIYTHGLAVMMMFDNFRMPKEEALRMMYEVGVKIMGSIGVEPPSEPFI